ncbi:hypothetical protein BS35_007629 [Actinomadura glauciflava]|nr:hypothetical protein [Actinomadura glauciflava]
MPLTVFAAVVLVDGAFYLLVYAISGPTMPGLINQGDAEGPAPVGERLKAAAHGVPFLAILAYLTWRAARARLSTPKVAIDSRGVCGGAMTEARGHPARCQPPRTSHEQRRCGAFHDSKPVVLNRWASDGVAHDLVVGFIVHTADVGAGAAPRRPCLSMPRSTCESGASPQ